MSGDGQDPGEQEELVRLLCAEARAMADHLPAELREFSLRAGECEVTVRCEPRPTGAAAGAGAEASVPYEAAVASAGEALAGDRDGLTPVTAPLVGTFYRAAEPGAEPFVKVGDVVEEGQVVGIIEAMKLMNRIEATSAGRVGDILVEDQSMVEHGQALLLIEPAGADHGTAHDGGRS